MDRNFNFVSFTKELETIYIYILEYSNYISDSII